MTLDRHEIKVLKDKKRFGLKDEYCIFQNINAFSVLGLVVPPLVIKPLGSLLRAFSLLLFFSTDTCHSYYNYFFFSPEYMKRWILISDSTFSQNVILLLSTIMELNPIKWFSILHFMFDLWIYEYIFLGIIIQSELLFFFLLLNCYIQISFFVITIIVNKFLFMRIIFNTKTFSIDPVY